MRRSSLSSKVLVAALVFAGPATAAEKQRPIVEGRTYQLEPVTPYDLRGDVRDLPWVPQREWVEFELDESEPLLTSSVPAQFGRSPQLTLAPAPAPLQTFAGMSRTDTCVGGQCGSGWPPDINGDVGPNHYIEGVNAAYAIYSKTGTLLASFTENSLYGGSGLPQCDGHSTGDPVVLYDRLADRWILSHFAFSFSGGVPVSPFYQCIAASKTSDPVSGGWWLYAVRMDPGGAGLPPVGQLNDYGKFGIWHDCLYMATNQFQFPAGSFAGTAFASFSRADLYSGAALTMSIGVFDTSVDASTMIPSNLLGRSVPAGTPNYFVSETRLSSNNAFLVRKFTAGPNCGAGGTMGAATSVSHTSYTVSSPGAAQQPNTSQTLDSLGRRLMQKVQYRKVGANESLWVSHTVQNSGQALAPQWAQINVTGGTVATTPVQQQIFQPDTTLARWMPSIAVDRRGNALMGYSTSNNSVPNFPSIAWAGRLAADPVGTLPQSETQMTVGAGSQTNSCGGGACTRWGDYTAMSVDPADECTFWYANMYYSSQTTGTAGNWQTRIGSTRFPSCGAPSDFGTDGKSDVMIYRSGAWLPFNYDTGAPLTGIFTGQPSPSCIPAPADYDGNGAVEFSQLCGANWLFYNSSGTLTKTIVTGGSADYPVPADYDGDGAADVTLFRDGTWLTWSYSTGAFVGGVFTGNPPPFTGPRSVPLPGDFDGDGRADFSIHAGGPWHFYNANGTYLKGIWTGSIAGDFPVPGDYNNDGADDVVVWRNGAWLWFDYATGNYVPGNSVFTGNPTNASGGANLPAALDVDGNGSLDRALYAGGPWHFYNPDGSYLKGIWCGAVPENQPISRRQLP